MELATAAGVIKPIRRGAEKVISHLLFADDMLIFSKENVETLRGIDVILEKMAQITGLAINKMKSKIYFMYWKKQLGLQKGNCQQNIWGSLTIQYPKARHYTSLVDRCRERIEGWMSTTLSFSGRVELIKTVTLGTLQYWLQSFKFPVSTIKTIESTSANFWRNKMHAWSWETLCKPKSEGGLAIRRVHVLI